MQSGPIETFIPLKVSENQKCKINIDDFVHYVQKDRNEYVYDSSSITWVQKDQAFDKRLERGVRVRYRILQLKYVNNKFSVVGTIDEDYLGAYNKRNYGNLTRD